MFPLTFAIYLIGCRKSYLLRVLNKKLPQSATKLLNRFYTAKIYNQLPNPQNQLQIATANPYYTTNLILKFSTSDKFPIHTI